MRGYYGDALATMAETPPAYEIAVADYDWSCEITIGYWRRYCPQALETLNFEVLARTHNGGSGGIHNTQALNYWYRVRAVLRQHGFAA